MIYNHPPINNLYNWESVFEELKSLNKNCIIECENIENGEFYIGKIVEVNRESVQLLYFNVVGVWDKVPTEIFLEI